MLTVIDQNNRREHQALVEAARRLRHEVFVEEMGWAELASPTPGGKPGEKPQKAAAS